MNAPAEQRRCELRSSGNSADIQDPPLPLVVTANGEVQTKDEATVYVNDLESRIRQQFCRLESSAKTTDIPLSGPAVKSHT